MKMFRSLAMALAGLVLMAACASGPQYAYRPWKASIADPGEIYSTLDWMPELEKALVDAGRSPEMATIKAHYTEPGWPSKLADIDTRLETPDTIKLYKVETIARFQFDGNDVILLRASAASNAHMPEGWRPSEDIFIPIRATAVAPAK